MSTAVPPGTAGATLDDAASRASSDQAARLRAIMARVGPRETGPDRPASPSPLKPATLGGRLGAQGWGQPATAPPRPTHLDTASRAHSRVIAIASGKGGVGKTNLTVSLAATLARMGCKVTLLDADFGLANADVLSGVSPRARIDDVLSGSRKISDILVETPYGFRLAAGTSGVARLVDSGAQTARAVIARLERLERESDAVLIDCAAGIARPVLAMLLAADLPIVVATPEPTSLTDAYGLIKALRIESQRAGTPLTPQLWINQAQNEAEAHAVYERVARVGERFLGAPIGMIGWTPACPSVPAAVRARSPVVASHPSRPAALSVRRTAEEIIARLELHSEPPERTDGFFRRLVTVLRPK